jgi:hypothetical protein
VRAWLVAAAVVAVSLTTAVPASAADAVAIPECSPGPANCAGWHAGPVVVKWHLVNEDMSVGCDTRTANTDGVARLTCSVHDVLGWHDFNLDMHVDQSAPTATGALTSRPTDANGWFNHPVDVAFAGTDAVSGIATCSAMTYAGPDTAQTTLSGHCTDEAGNVSEETPFMLRYDATAPDVTSAVPTRRPDHHGWFNHPVGLRIKGTDGLSGLAGCAPTTVTAPQAIAACADKAGNVGARAVALPYDDTAPGLRVSAEPADGRAYVRWRVREATAIKVVRSPGVRGARRSVVFRGRGRARGHGLSDGGLSNGRRYVYAITAVDRAGNAKTRAARVVPGARLLGPRSGATLSRPPLLRWTRVRHARYYNVQLYRVVRGHARKVMSTWPQRSRLRLERTWRYRGARRALVPGLYRWFVWPGRGAPSERRFGALIGRGTFRITGARPPT